MMSPDTSGLISPAMREYLRLHAKYDSLDRLPEGSIAALLNTLPPEELKTALHAKQMFEDRRDSGWRSAPFEQKSPPALDPYDQAITNRSMTEDITHGLNARMGTPTTVPTGADVSTSAPPGLRDIIEAAANG